jgi:hypothetical protein
LIAVEAEPKPVSPQCFQGLKRKTPWGILLLSSGVKRGVNSGWGLPPSELP